MIRRSPWRWWGVLAGFMALTMMISGCDLGTYEKRYQERANDLNSGSPPAQ